MSLISGIPAAQALTGLINAPAGGSARGARLHRWEFTSELRERESRRFAMAINPKSITFDQDKRWTKQDTREGSVYFHFTNRKGQNNDILTVRFRGNTGNIDPRGDLEQPLQDTNRTGATSKLTVWHNLYKLTREPIILPDNTINVVSLTYSSQLLPLDITFRGFFGKVLEFEESAEKPNSRDYGFDFIVTNTQPDLDDYFNELTTIIAPLEVQEAADSALFGISVDSSGG